MEYRARDGAPNPNGRQTDRFRDAGAKGRASATPVVKLNSAAELKAAAKHAAPNTRYEYGTYYWTTGKLRRTIECGGEVDPRPAGRNDALQRKIGHEGKSTDVGFHLIGDRFNGPTNRLNVVPANGKPLGDGLPNLNTGAWQKFEKQIAKLAANKNDIVEVRIRLQYDTGNLTNRPDSFLAAYRVNGGKWIEREFVNKPVSR